MTVTRALSSNPYPPVWMMRSCRDSVGDRISMLSVVLFPMLTRTFMAVLSSASRIIQCSVNVSSHWTADLGNTETSPLTFREVKMALAFNPSGRKGASAMATTLSDWEAVFIVTNGGLYGCREACAVGQFHNAAASRLGMFPLLVRHVYLEYEASGIGKDAERRAFRRIASGLCLRIGHNAVALRLYLNVLFRIPQCVLLLALQAVKDLPRSHPRTWLYPCLRNKRRYRGSDCRFALIGCGRYENGFLRDMSTDGMRQGYFRSGFRFGGVLRLPSCASSQTDRCEPQEMYCFHIRLLNSSNNCK